MLVTAKAQDGQIEQVELVLPCDMQVKIQNAFGAQALNCTQNKAKRVLIDRDGYFLVQGKKGKIVLQGLKV